MLEELRTVLDRLDHLLIKITPPLIVTPLISLCTPQSQLPVVSQSQEGEHADNDNEHDDDAQIIDSAAIRIDKGQDGMDNDDSDESERRANENRNIDDNIIIPQINIRNNNCDTTSKKCPQ